MNKRTTVLVALYFLLTAVHYAILPFCLLLHIPILSWYVLLPALTLRFTRYSLAAYVGIEVIKKSWKSAKSIVVKSWNYVMSCILPQRQKE